jgi:DNA-binding MarR family transcriptional regulator
MAPSALARAEHVKPPSMTKVIESLEERGLVRRDPHPTDRRQCLISRTSEGEAFVEETRRRRTEWLARQMSELSADERALLLAAGPVLDRLADRPCRPDSATPSVIARAGAERPAAPSGAREPAAAHARA